eukprot:6085947-Pleurochrysis_carterae.AAC.1
MCEKRYPLSCALLALAGMVPQSPEMVAARQSEARESSRGKASATSRKSAARSASTAGEVQTPQSSTQQPALTRRKKAQECEKEWRTEDEDEDEESLSFPSLSESA